MTLFTVLGGEGFIGRHLVLRLQEMGHGVHAPERGDLRLDRDLGKVIYCAGVTADFRARPFDTAAAHVDLPSRILRDGSFTSFTYLSSARVYKRIAGPATEDDVLVVRADDLDDLYGLSKLMGEAIGFASGRPFQSVRISNVYGPDFSSQNFLSWMLKRAVSGEPIMLDGHPDSTRDYVAIDQVVALLIQIAEVEVGAIYNIASGVPTSTRAIIDALRALTGCEVKVQPDAPVVASPVIDVSRIKSQFGFTARDVIGDLPRLVESFRSAGEIWQ